MECNNCGYECERDSSFCNACGHDFDNSFYGHQSFSHRGRSSHRHSYNRHHSSYNNATNYPILWALVFGIAGLAVGVLSFMTIWLLHFVGLGLGITALILARRAAHEDAPLSTAAIIISIVSVGMSFVGIFVIACTCAFACEILDCG